VRLRDVHTLRGYDLDLTAAEYERRRERLKSYEVLAAYDLETVDISSGTATAALAPAAHVTPELFGLAAMSPLLGRVIAGSDVEPGAPPVVVIGEGLWRRWFGGDAAALGQTVRVKGEARTVIGVMPAPFGFPGDRVDVWLPLATRLDLASAPNGDLKIVGRLRADISLRQAESELSAVLPTQRTDVEDAEHVRAQVTPFAYGSVSPQAAGFGWALVAALVLLLAIAAANVANLLLARNAARRGDLAVRAALGASRRRLMAQLLLEALMLAAAGTIAGAALAQVVLVRLRTVLVLPAWSDLDIDAIVLVFVLALALLSVLVAGVGPAWKATRTGSHDALKTVGRGGDALGFGRLSSTLIVTELCLSVALLGVAAVFGRAMLEFGRTDVQLPASDVFVAQLYWGQPPDVRAGATLTDAARRAVWAAHEETATEEQMHLAAALSSARSVRAVTYASHVPGMPLAASPIELEGRDRSLLTSTRIARVRPTFFDALDIRLLAGRDFHINETSVAVVNASFARRHFAGPARALGQRLRPVEFGMEPGRTGRWLEIVGVVADGGLNPGDPVHGDGLYLPLGAASVVELVVRMNGDAQAALPHLLEAVRVLNTDIEVQWTTTLRESIELPARIFRGVAIGFVVAGAVALMLSMLSLYALMSFSVTSRAREIGIRVAIGSTPGSVLAAVLGRGFRQMLLGFSIGAVLGLALTRIATSTIPFGLVRGGPVELAAIALLLATAGCAACLRPVRRVLSVDPIQAIRSE
jgi:predicted permease